MTYNEPVQTESGPEKLGRILRERRQELGLTLENVEAATRKAGTRVSTQFLSDTERAYVREGGSVTTPSDARLRALSEVLDIPLRDLHAALGRVPPGTLAASFVREKLAGYGADVRLSSEDMDALIADIEALGAALVNTRAQRAQKQEQPA